MFGNPRLPFGRNWFYSCKMKTGDIASTTRERILATAEQEIVQRGRAAVSLADIAEAGGVSRQTVYLAFGGRAGLLAALVARAGEKSPHAGAMRAIADSNEATRDALDAYLRAWHSHVPEIAAALQLLTAAAASGDDEARHACDEHGAAQRAVFAAIFTRLRRAGVLSPMWAPEAAADLAWSLTHVDRRRHLVDACGWPDDLYTEETIALVERVLLNG